MKLRVIVLPMAREDLRAYAAFLRAENPNLGDRFLLGAGDVFRMLMSHPHVGRLRAFTRPGSEGVRSISIRDFPNHLIFYRPLSDRVEIVRVMHGSMDTRPIFGPTVRRRRR